MRGCGCGDQNREQHGEHKLCKKRIGNMNELVVDVAIRTENSMGSINFARRESAT
jgi:hypothetical protein